MVDAHSANRGPQTSLDLTHVLYDDDSLFSLALALVTLSPILLMAAYASLAVQTREFLVIVMWAGQLANEGFNWILKRLYKEDRPDGSLGNGYGFPSSHSQYTWRVLVYIAVSAWGLLVAYSRYHLQYHTPYQILWGYGIGVVSGAVCYGCFELIPRIRPKSFLGQFKMFLVSNPVSTWLQIRDGWAIWSDGGREGDWKSWKAEWDKQRITSHDKRSQ
ncbi:PAP2-domain-containing protein [Lentinula novae-zelandiae]|nr:PAP2-domain-containing protein [Lentinula novae-zelandiae]